LSRRNRNKSPVGELIDQINPPQKKPHFKPHSISFKNKRQLQYYETIMSNQITVATGPAGTAKTFVSAYAALQQLSAGQIERIIVTKPTVEIGRTQGFLPGNLEEKMEPFTRSVVNCFEQIIGEAQTNTLIYSKKQVEVIPLQMIRGLTLDNCFIIADEMQNSSYMQMKALLTRLGEESTLVVNGDVEQQDTPEQSGLGIALKVLRNIDDVGFVEFSIDDIVRSGITKDIIIAFHELEKRK
jgi:phosphate starvation-inducible PhoH-like protein